jgi:glycosyltransferase involved in cell wall biosynthesis
LPARRGQLRAEFGLGGSSLTVGIVGRLTSIKNHDLFFRAARACGVADARFLVIGDGERAGELRGLADSLGLDGRVVFTSWQNDPSKIYADLDIACLTSLNEGTPLALIEAMAAGVPVVATRVGGVRDLMVGEGTPHAGFEVFANGILISPNDPTALGAAVEYLAERPEGRRAMGAVGQGFVQRRFCLSRLLAETAQLYSDVLHG